MMYSYYLLDEKNNPYPVNLQEWAETFEIHHDNKHVRFTDIAKYGVSISTVFLGIDHGYPQWSGHTKNYKPVLFETMVYWNPDHALDEYQERYHTWDEALKGHREAVRNVIKYIRNKLDNEYQR